MNLETFLETKPTRCGQCGRFSYGRCLLGYSTNKDSVVCKQATVKPRLNGRPQLQKWSW